MQVYIGILFPIQSFPKKKNPDVYRHTSITIKMFSYVSVISVVFCQI